MNDEGFIFHSCDIGHTAFGKLLVPTNTTIKTMKKIILGAFVLAAAVAGPAYAYAATFAYVAANGDVKSMTATTPEQALMTAPDIHVRSGVMLIDGAQDMEVIGDDVQVAS